MKTIVNCETGEQNDIPLTPEEESALELEREEIEQNLLIEEEAKLSKIAAKAALLEKLGITEEEARLLLS